MLPRKDTTAVAMMKLVINTEKKINDFVVTPAFEEAKVISSVISDISAAVANNPNVKFFTSSLDQSWLYKKICFYSKNNPSSIKDTPSLEQQEDEKYNQMERGELLKPHLS